MSSDSTQPEPSPIFGERRAVIGWLVAVLVLGAGLFLYEIDRNPLTGDELNILDLARGDRDINLSAGNALGYFPIVRFVASYSISETALRMPALLFGLVGLVMTYLLATTLYRDRTLGVASALLLAVSPIYVNHAQLLHSYTAFCSASLATFLLIWKAYHERLRWAWVAWAIMVGLSTWLHLYTIFVAGAEMVMLACWIWADHRGRLRLPNKTEVRNGAALLGIITLIFLPIILDWIVPLGQSLLAKTQGQEVSYQVLKDQKRFDPWTLAIYEQVFQRLLVWLGPLTKLWPILAVPFLGGLWWTLRRHPRVGYAFLIWFIVPFVPIVIFSHLSSIDLGVRRIIFMSPIIAMAWAAGCLATARGFTWLLSKLWRTLPKAAFRTAGLGVLSCLLAGLIGITALDSYYRYAPVLDFRTAARVIEMHGKPDDLIYSWPTRMTEHYYNGKATFIGPINQHLDALEKGSRIWFVRPGGWKHSGHIAPQEAVIEEKGAPTLILGGGLVLSVLIPENDPLGLTYKEVSSTIVTLKPDCASCIWQLSAEFHREGQNYAVFRERNRSRALLERDVLLNALR